MTDRLGPTITSRNGTPSRLYSAADLEAGPAMQQDAAGNTHMEEFFSEVSAIKEQLTSIKVLQDKLLAAHNKSKLIARSADMMEIREVMQDQMDEVSKIAHSAKTRLEVLQQGNQTALEHKSSKGASSTQLHYSYERTRANVTAGLCKKLKDLMGEFQAVRTQLVDDHRRVNLIHNAKVAEVQPKEGCCSASCWQAVRAVECNCPDKKCRDVVEKRIHIVTGKKPSSKDVDHLIDTGESEAIFKTAIQKQGRGHALDAMAEIQERHEAVQDLEESLADLHQIFLDMSVLVDNQGEMLNNIEQQVNKSKLSVETGVTELVQARTYQKRSQRWMCWAAAFAVITGIIIVVAVIIAVKA